MCPFSKIANKWKSLHPTLVVVVGIRKVCKKGMENFKAGFSRVISIFFFQHYLLNAFYILSFFSLASGFLFYWLVLLWEIIQIRTWGTADSAYCRMKFKNFIKCSRYSTVYGKWVCCLVTPEYSPTHRSSPSAQYSNIIHISPHPLNNIAILYTSLLTLCTI